MPKSTKEGWVNWRYSPARDTLMQAFGQGGVLRECYPLPSAHDAWNRLFKDHPAFSDVVFDQFKVRYNEYVKKANVRRQRSVQEEEWLKEARKLVPRKKHDENGKLLFDTSAAKDLMKQDIKEGKHEQAGGVAAFRASRPEYMQFSEREIAQRIRQYIKLHKFHNHLEANQLRTAAKKAAKK